MMRARVVTLGVMGALAIASVARADDETPFVYEQAPARGAGAWTLELDSAVGTRDTRPTGWDGLEEALRLRRRLGDRFELSASAGMLLSTRSGETLAGGGSVEAAWQLPDLGLGVRMSLGGGWAYDYRGVHVLRGRAGLTRRFGRLDVATSGVVEVPLAGERDAVDVIVSAGAALRLTPSVHAGLEAVGEDLEGFWTADEAEGGARLVAGPTLSWHLGSIDLRMNAGAVVQATGPTDAPSSTRTGFLGRLVLATSF